MPIPVKKEAAPPKTAKERVYNEMREWIISGTLEPGERISDQEIAKYFSVSRTPVREAIQLLADQKLVTVLMGRETRVADINLDEADHLYKLMAVLNQLALEFSFDKMTSQVLQKLRQNNKLLKKAVDARDIKKSLMLDREFHHTFLELSGSYFLNEFCSVLDSHIVRIEHAYYQQLFHGINSVTGHEVILDALEQKNLDKAKEAMAANWLDTLPVLDELKQKNN